MALEDEMRDAVLDEIEDASYPVTSPMQLIPALSNGPSTVFEAGDVSVKAMELASALSSHQDFPYDTPEDLADDVIEGMKEEDIL